MDASAVLVFVVDSFACCRHELYKVARSCVHMTVSITMAITVAFCQASTMLPSLLRTLACCVLAVAVGDAATAAQRGISRSAVYRQVSVLTELGRMLFFDRSLSASGQLSCASCHVPERAYGPLTARPVAVGGKDMRQLGLRAVPSLRYMQVLPHFTEHFFDSDDEPNAGVDNGPTGGLTWDGRADRGRDQARLPLLSPSEMANESPAAIVARVKKSTYAGLLRNGFGATIFDNTEKAFAGILQALEAFEQRPTEFYPYSSRYDAYLAGKAALAVQEARGLAAFNDPAKGNCAHCHPSVLGADGTPPQFTDYGFAALGVPRNMDIPSNADPAFYDLGLCGPLRTDLRDRPEYCGMFKAPTLRNVALRRSFFHNGVFHTLKDVLRFYAERDTDPEKWYQRNADGTVRKFDDLPARYHTNVNVEPPFDRHVGDQPVLSAQDIDDIIAFLQTLNDGYRSD
jgi:cytochrome c peroxidase